MNSPSDLDQSKWYCFRTKKKHEQIACRIVADRYGFQTFCPMISRIKKTLSCRQRYTTAMFIGYVFVQLESVDLVYSVQNSQSIHSPVKYGGIFPAIPNSFILSLRDELDNDVLNLNQESLINGQFVKILKGPFSDQIGKILNACDDKGRASLLIEFMGNLVAVDFSSESLEPVDEEIEPRCLVFDNV